MGQYLQPLELSEAGRWLTIGWCFVLGSCIGSFLNVVAYRLPRGMSLSRPDSSCPSCGKFIRWYDNVPIIGWLRLRGRCRDCHAPISPRYPLVEFLVAVASAWLVAVSIDRIAPIVPNGPEYAIVPVVVAVRLVVLYVLAAAALLEFDTLPVAGRLGTVVTRDVLEQGESRSPVRLLRVVTSMVVILGCVVPAAFGFSVRDASLCGTLLAVLFGALLWPWLIGQASLRDAQKASCGVLALVMVGATFGWQAVCGIGLLAALTWLLCLLAGRVWPLAARLGWAAWLIVATLLWLTLAPRVLPNCEPRPLGVVFVTGMLMAGLSLLGRLANGQSRRSLLTGG